MQFDRSTLGAAIATVLALLLFGSTKAAEAQPSDVGSAKLVPHIFAPGIISGPEHDAAPAFTPDGKSVYFYRSNGTHATIWVSKKINGRWSLPTIVEFSGAWSDMEPTLSPDGRFMIFISNRPAETGGSAIDGLFNGKNIPGGGGNLWRVERTARGWGTPVRLNGAVNTSSSTFAPAVVADGSLYFMRPEESTGRFRLFRSQFKNGEYEAPLPLPFSSGESTDVDPVVAPDESFMVFSSGRKPAKDVDLFIVHRKNGKWGTPEHLGDVVNSPGSDAEARLSPDSKTLYFSSERLLPTDTSLPRPAWDNGKYNIWFVSIEPWRNRP